jgi:NTP pyrophosphatase (non-canonical NTP hydrolase)
MQSKQYLEDSARTAPTEEQNSKTIERIITGHEEVHLVDLLHAGIGMSTESAEFLDALKKHMFYGKPLDTVNLKEEVADQLWYCALALRALGANFEEVMETNIAKLKARYPNKFDEEKALTRDLETERKILEGKE